METGLCVSTWGAPAWHFLHATASGYPVNPDEYDLKNNNPLNYTRRNYINFYKNTGKILPCGLCRKSYELFLDEIKIENYTDSRRSLMEFVFKIHNKVNEKLGVPQEPDSEKIYQKFESFHARCPKKEDAKGCIEPKGNFVKMKCRVITEPYHKSYRRIIIFTILFFILILINKYKQNSRK